MKERMSINIFKTKNKENTIYHLEFYDRIGKKERTNWAKTLEEIKEVITKYSFPNTKILSYSENPDYIPLDETEKSRLIELLKS